MKGRIHSFESFGTVDGPGVRFVVFMQGCPMRCKYCHNPDTWDTSAGKEYTPEEVVKEILKYKSYIQKGGVTFSGGEPLAQIDFVTEVMRILQFNGIHTAVDTSGITFNADDPRSVEKHEKLLKNCDLVLMDIKHMDDESHRALTGQSNKNPLAFAKFVSDKGVDLWIRHVLVSGITDFNGHLTRLKAFIDTLKTVKKVEVLPYHSMAEAKYEKMGIAYPLKGSVPPAEGRVENAKKILCH